MCNERVGAISTATFGIHKFAVGNCLCTEGTTQYTGRGRPLQFQRPYSRLETIAKVMITPEFKISSSLSCRRAPNHVPFHRLRAHGRMPTLAEAGSIGLDGLKQNERVNSASNGQVPSSSRTHIVLALWVRFMFFAQTILQTIFSKKVDAPNPFLQISRKNLV